MSDNGTNRSRIRFGIYEADLEARELRRRGMRVKLQDQPFQVLGILLQRHGEIVTREELQEAVWPGDTFVEFDHGLNVAVQKIRSALRDDASNPRFIETIPRRGYRFIEPLREQRRQDGGASAVRTLFAAAMRKRWTPWVLIGVALSLFLAMKQPRSQEPIRPPLRRFSFSPDARPQPSNFNSNVAISPNGKYIAYIGGENRQLWVQDLTLQEPRAIRDAEGAEGPFWSHDSEHILFSMHGALRMVPLQGGTSRLICRHRGYISGTLSPDGTTIVFPGGDPPSLYEVPFAGGEPNPVFSTAELHEIHTTYANGAVSAIAHPMFLPREAGDRTLLFELGFPGSRIQRILLLDLEDGKRKVFGAGSEKYYSPTGHLLYQNGADIWAISFSTKKLTTEGEPFLVRRNGRGPTVANDGTLVYLDRTIPERQLVWRDRSGRKLGAVGGVQKIPRVYPAPRISPDGSKIIVITEEDAAGEIWIYDTERQLTTRVTSDPSFDYSASWSPDGSKIALSSSRDGEYDIFLAEPGRGGPPRKLSGAPGREVVDDWSPDGKHIFYRLNQPDTQADIWYLQEGDDGGWTPHPYLQTNANERYARVSPDGGFVAYESDESGRWEVYVRRFPDEGERLLVSVGGGHNPVWGAGGRELFYTQGDTLMAVPISLGRTPSAGQPERVFDHPNFREMLWTISPDGTRVLLAEEIGDTPEPRIRVVQNWYEEFRGRVPN